MQIPRRATLASMSAALITVALAGTASAAIPKPPGPPTTLPAFIGTPAVANPIKGSPNPDQNPFMAPNEDASGHNDSWQTDTYRRSGPLGSNPVQASNGSFTGDCVSPTFDADGRLVTICTSPFDPGPFLKMIDPVTLDVLASTPMPNRLPPVPGVPVLKDTSGGVYFYIDNKNRVVNVTPNNHIRRYSIVGNTFVLDKDWDIGAYLNLQYPATDAPRERLTSALPDWNGLIWFVSRVDGIVGTLDPQTDAVKITQLGQGFEDSIENSFAVTQDGTFIATNRRMLKLHANAAGKPMVDWAKTYKNSGQFKPGQIDDGTGTTPTVIAGGMVAITDNADPMNVVVYRTDNGKQVCEQPVFGLGASASENSLIGLKNSLIVENNYGYDLLGFQTGA